MISYNNKIPFCLECEDTFDAHSPRLSWVRNELDLGSIEIVETLCASHQFPYNSGYWVGFAHGKN